MDRKFHIAIFASGAGSTLQTLIDNQMVYGYHVALVVTNRSCMALERAATHGIRALQTKDWEAIDIALETEKIDLIVLCHNGFARSGIIASSISIHRYCLSMVEKVCMVFMYKSPCWQPRIRRQVVRCTM